MTPRHPCPNCAALRPGPRAACEACGYPNHARPSPRRKLKPVPFQFHLATLFACMTVSAITFAVLNAIGIDGLKTALRLGVIFFPLIEILLHWRNAIEWEPSPAPRPNASPFDEADERSSKGNASAE